jgi:hypothetical protein
MLHQALSLPPQSDTCCAAPSDVIGHRLCWLLRFYIRLLLDDDRECESKRRALTNLRLDPDFAAVHLDDALGYGESRAGAALLACNRIVGLLNVRFGSTAEWTNRSSVLLSIAGHLQKRNGPRHHEIRISFSRR